MVIKKKTAPSSQKVKRNGAKNPVAKKDFTAAAATAAKSAVETLSLGADQKAPAPRRRVTFAVGDAPSKSSVKKVSDSATASSAAVAARRAAVGGIIEAKKRRRPSQEEDNEREYDDDDDKEYEEKRTNDDVDSSSDGDSDSYDNDDDDDLSDIAASADGDDDSDASDEAAWENPFEKAKRDGTRLSYPALRLRFLPPEFEEPQLFKFLSQFGGQVLNCFCVRSRRTHRSKGIAYVQFDREEVLETALEECHGMALGGRAVQAQRVTLHRAMPSKEKAARRRRLGYAYKTHGAPLQRHDVRKKGPVAALIKYARAEKANNEHLKRLGIDYEFCEFQEQLKNVPKEMFIKKERKQRTEKNRAAVTTENVSSQVQGEDKNSKKSKKSKKVTNGVESVDLSSSLKPEKVTVKTVKREAAMPAASAVKRKPVSKQAKQRVARK